MRHVSAFNVIASEERIDQSHHWLFPETYEIFFGGAASLLIFGLLYWKAWPLIKKSMAGRTGRIQEELDNAATAVAEAEAEAAEIRRAKGDIGAERNRLFADADVQAEALITDGRARLDNEIAELDERADADVQAAMGRGQDELRGEIARIAATAADSIVSSGLDDATQQSLIESYIQRVGATSQPARSGAR